MPTMKNNIFNLSLVLALLFVFVLGCQSPSDSNSATKPTATAAPKSETKTDAKPDTKPITIQAKNLTKEYDDNELAADGKYKGKVVEVSGKVSNIAETMGNVTVQLEGHNIAKTVMCSFAESEKESVAKLKKGQNATLIGTGDGMTLGLYAGLKDCKVK